MVRWVNLRVDSRLVLLGRALSGDLRGSDLACCKTAVSLLASELLRSRLSFAKILFVSRASTAKANGNRLTRTQMGMAVLLIRGR